MSHADEWDDAQQRLDELTSFFFNETEASRGLSLIEQGITSAHPNLCTMLRHHSEPPGDIEESLTWDRDAVDFLLAYYSIIEIASSLQSLPDPLPSSLKTTAIRVLSQPAVRRYYETHYPLLLPRLFLKRLERGRGSRVTFIDESEQSSRSQAYYLFSEFVSLVRRVASDGDIETFQWFLDDGFRYGVGLPHTLAAIRSREKFAECVQVEESRRGPLEKSIVGFQKFVEFCIQFNELLKLAQPFPVFELLMWSYFSYWFVELKENVGSEVRKAVRLFATWDPLDENDREAATKEVADYIEAADTAISNLIRDRREEIERLMLMT
jgi:hypothetical protein